MVPERLNAAQRAAAAEDGCTSVEEQRQNREMCLAPPLSGHQMFTPAA